MLNHTDHHLDNDLRAVESDLSDLLPHPLPQDLLARMEAELSGLDCLDSDLDSVCVVGDDLNELEIHLTQLSPAAMPEDMLARMSEAMDRWQDNTTAEENVVSLEPQKRSRGSRFFGGGMLSAAAAVAVLGAVASLAWPQVKVSNSNVADVAQPEAEPASTVVMNNPSLQSTPVALSSSVMGASSGGTFSSAMQSHVQPVNFTPSGLTHDLVGTRDHGVILSKNNVPHRFIRVDYVDRVNGTDAQGRKIEIKTPGVDFMLIPLETD